MAGIKIFGLCAVTFACLAQDARAELILFDTFNVSANSQDVNFGVALRQSGSQAVVTYTDGGEPIFSQVGNGEAAGALLMTGRAGGTSGRISLNSNFTASPGQGTAFVIEFDVNPVLTNRPEFNATQSSWISINFGTSLSTRNQDPQSNNGIGLLLRGNGQTQAFDSGVFLGDSQFAPGADDLFHHIRIEISDLVGANPFDGDGTPALIRAYSDGGTSPFFEHVRATGFSSNYISIIGQGEGAGGDGVVRHALDNFTLQTAAVPEPPTFVTSSVGLLLASIGVAGLRTRRGKQA